MSVRSGSDPPCTVIIGAKSEEQLRDNLGATELALSAEELKRLDEVSALPKEYPGWMIDRQSAERVTK
jgi:aryl-alcohol dehydrogenase-like predicted oxidoreductase